MKFLLTICLLLISTPSTASAQQSQKQHASLIRAQTREAERRLADMGYWTGAVDGVFDPGTRSALIAFQKWEGRPITGQLTIAEFEAIRTSASPKAKDTGYAHLKWIWIVRCY
ncbi:MAG: peptidoglycan-binding protein [Pyrinomonadaceae bacterium]|nr:peptidoglycan-binding protein [Pyrinomonadaceae bacterium]